MLRRYPGPMSVVVPRDASTVMLVRDVAAGGPGAGSTAMQVLLLRRNDKSTWVAGVHLFPGGAVDDEDANDEIARYCEGRSDAQASRILGVPAGGRKFFVAAVRECFEEAGILLALAGQRKALSLRDPEVARRFVDYRRRLNAGEVQLHEICAAESLALDLNCVGYFSHWITPEGSPRRYDTRFFVARVPEEQEALHDDAEVVASMWIEPARAIERHRVGEVELWLPTLRNLEAIATFPCTAALMAAVSVAEDPRLPLRLAAEGEGARILLPTDEGYEEALARQTGASSPTQGTRAESLHRSRGLRSD